MVLIACLYPRRSGRIATNVHFWSTYYLSKNCAHVHLHHLFIFGICDTVLCIVQRSCIKAMGGRCLHKLIHYKGENALNYIVASS